jgi:hypothetical protein
MNCIEFRHRVGAEPNTHAEALKAHAASCESCVRYWRRTKQMDELIHRALSIDAIPSAPGRPASHGTTLSWAVAASFIAAVTLGSLLWLAQPKTSLAQELVEHVRHEAATLERTPTRVDETELSSILQQAGIRLKSGSAQVSYAMSCWFRGHQVPHLVAQTADGPITVLVLRHENSVSKPQSFEEAGFSGVLRPAPKGAVAVLGRGESVATAARAVLDALDYET